MNFYLTLLHPPPLQCISPSFQEQGHPDVLEGSVVITIRFPFRIVTPLQCSAFDHSSSTNALEAQVMNPASIHRSRKPTELLTCSSGKVMKVYPNLSSILCTNP